MYVCVRESDKLNNFCRSNGVGNILFKAQQNEVANFTFNVTSKREIPTKQITNK